MWPDRVCEIVVTEVAPAGLAPNAMGGHRRIVQQHLLEHYSCCQGGGASLWIASARDVCRRRSRRRISCALCMA